MTAGAATIKDFALEWEIACGFVQQTFFLWAGPRPLLRSQTILVLGTGRAVTAPGGRVAVATLQCPAAPPRL